MDFVEFLIWIEQDPKSSNVYEKHFNQTILYV